MAMPAKIIVPADFGIENLYSRLHGNITVQVQGHSEDIQVNSLILSFNSPVFVEIFRDIDRTVLDMKDYSTVAVRVFIEALYTGRVKLEKDLLKDFSKLASRYKVAWLIIKCHNYFNDLLDHVTDHVTDHVPQSTDITDDLFMLFEEACYIKLHIGDPVYLQQVLDKIASTGNKASDCIERYMDVEYLELSKYQIDLMISISPVDYQVYLKIIYKHVLTNQSFDGTSRVLLQQVDLVRAMEADTKLYEKLIDYLLKKLDSISLQDKIMVQRQNAETLKKYKERNPGTSIIRCVSFKARALKTLKRLGTRTELKLLPSKYHVFQCYTILEDLPLDKFLDILSLSSQVKSLFMLLEAVDMFGCWDNFTTNSLQRIITVTGDRGWSRIPAHFLDSLYWLNDRVDKLTMLRECCQLFADNNHTVIVSKQTTTPKKFLLEETFYKFPFPRPRTTTCVVLSTQCGILVRVSPLSQDGGEKFNITMVTDSALYGAHQMHFHPMIVHEERVHFVVEMYNVGEEDGINMEIAWRRGNPEFKEDQIYWGGWHWGDTHKARVIVYYDNSK